MALTVTIIARMAAMMASFFGFAAGGEGPVAGFEGVAGDAGGADRRHVEDLADLASAGFGDALAVAEAAVFGDRRRAAEYGHSAPVEAAGFGQAGGRGERRDAATAAHGRQQIGRGLQLAERGAMGVDRLARLCVLAGQVIDPVDHDSARDRLGDARTAACAP